MEILFQETIDLERVAALCDVGFGRCPSIPAQRDCTAWHVTGLLEAGRLIARGDNRYPEGKLVAGIMSLGLIWESVMDSYLWSLAENHSGFYAPDVVYGSDDVVGSLDGILLGLDGFPVGLGKFPDLMVVECKLRFTLNEDIPLNHLQQVRAYCYLAETDLVCYVSGHLSSTPPTARALLRVIRFTQLSIQETWQGILNTKRYLESLGLGPEGVL